MPPNYTQKPIEMNPMYCNLLVDSTDDRKHKKCIKAAFRKYKKTCVKAFDQLLADLKKCQKG